MYNCNFIRMRKFNLVRTFCVFPDDTARELFSDGWGEVVPSWSNLYIILTCIGGYSDAAREE